MFKPSLTPIDELDLSDSETGTEVQVTPLACRVHQLVLSDTPFQEIPRVETPQYSVCLFGRDKIVIHLASPGAIEPAAVLSPQNIPVKKERKIYFDSTKIPSLSTLNINVLTPLKPRPKALQVKRTSVPRNPQKMPWHLWEKQPRLIRLPLEIQTSPVRVMDRRTTKSPKPSARSILDQDPFEPENVKPLLHVSWRSAPLMTSSEITARLKEVTDFLSEDNNRTKKRKTSHKNSEIISQRKTFDSPRIILSVVGRDAIIAHLSSPESISTAPLVSPDDRKSRLLPPKFYLASIRVPSLILRKQNSHEFVPFQSLFTDEGDAAWNLWFDASTEWTNKFYENC